MTFIAAVLLAAWAAQPVEGVDPSPAQASPAVQGEAGCVPDRWGVCGTVFDDLPDPDEESVAYQTGLEAVNDEPAQVSDDDATREGCRRIRQSYRDPVTSAFGYRFGVTCVETSGSPLN